MVQIGIKMLPHTRKALKDLLVEHINVFTWSDEDMHKIDNAVIEHNLYVNLNRKKVR